jgi:hypothetical protein
MLRYCTIDSSKYMEPPTFWLLSPGISLSIIVLADSLTKGAFEITQFRYNLDWGVIGLLVNRMTELGWCKNAISILTTAQQVHMLYCASSLGSPPEKKDHCACTEYVCKADQIDEQNYSAKHRPDCAGCAYVRPSITNLVKILEKRSTPLISYREVNGQVEVEVIENKNSLDICHISQCHTFVSISRATISRNVLTGNP